MGITIIQKCDPVTVSLGSKKALILAGGAVTGGSFMAGGVKALSDYFVDYSVNDFDIFIGISSGSMVAAALMAGITPESVLRSLDGTSKHFSKLDFWHYYYPNVGEFFERPISFLAKATLGVSAKFLSLARQYRKLPAKALGAIWKFVNEPTVSTYEDLMGEVMDAAKVGLPKLVSLLPSGIFDNRSIESYFRNNIERNGLTNDFKKAYKLTGKRLYIPAMRLDTAKRIIFGSDEDASLKISEAIQASTALPGFYRPARINGIDYVDGGVQESADIDIAVEKGANLIVCYNAFRPFEAGEFVAGFKKHGEHLRLATDGIMAILNQIFRAFFRERLLVALNHYRQSEDYCGDIVLIEPRPDDKAFFALNPLLLKNRVEAARLGFESVVNSIDANYNEISRLMLKHGISMDQKKVGDRYGSISKSPDCSDVQQILEGRETKTKRQRKKSKGISKKKQRYTRPKR